MQKVLCDHQLCAEDVLDRAVAGPKSSLFFNQDLLSCPQEVVLKHLERHFPCMTEPEDALIAVTAVTVSFFFWHGNHLRLQPFT